MEKGKLDPVAERAEEADAASTDEQDILRYEERITQLLVTITHLHGKVERLQQRGAREDEEYSDQCSEYTASLPRCAPQPLPPRLPPPREGVGPDMFLALQQVLASLEHTVSARRCCVLQLAGAGAETGTGSEERAQVVETLEELERGLGLSPGLEMAAVQAPGERVAELSPELGAVETSWYGKEAGTLAERNVVLRAALGSKEQELSRAQVTLQALQEERDRLQRKVKELQDSLYQLETPGQAWSPPGSATTPIRGAGSPVGEGDPWLLQDPLARAQSLLQCLKDHPAMQPLCRLLPSAPELSGRELDDQLQQLRGCIERLKGLNHLLVGALRECKSDSERLSMLLGQHESNSTALRLAAQCSEHRMEALEVLLALARAKLDAGGCSPSAAPVEHASQDTAAVLAEARRFLGRAEPDGQEAAGEPGMCGQQRYPGIKPTQPRGGGGGGGRGGAAGVSPAATGGAGSRGGLPAGAGLPRAPRRRDPAQRRHPGQGGASRPGLAGCPARGEAPAEAGQDAAAAGAGSPPGVHGRRKDPAAPGGEGEAGPGAGHLHTRRAGGRLPAAHRAPAAGAGRGLRPPQPRQQHQRGQHGQQWGRGGRGPEGSCRSTPKPPGPGEDDAGAGQRAGSEQGAAGPSPGAGSLPGAAQRGQPGAAGPVHRPRRRLLPGAQCAGAGLPGRPQEAGGPAAAPGSADGCHGRAAGTAGARARPAHPGSGGAARGRHRDLHLGWGGLCMATGPLPPP